jgi:hypothetical protein
MPATADVIEPGQIAWYRKAVPGLFVLLIACSFGGTLVCKLRVDGIFACPANGYGSNAYLSDCTARTYGDYDHGAFWFGLEPQAQHAAADADVLLVGSSRLQFAFGGKAAAGWFLAPGIRYYLLGFSNSETVAFFGPLLSKMRPRNRFFKAGTSSYDTRKSGLGSPCTREFALRYPSHAETVLPCTERVKREYGRGWEAGGSNPSRYLTASQAMSSAGTSMRGSVRSSLSSWPSIAAA